MKNQIEDLRNHLFGQLERLSDDEEMKDPKNLEKELQRAKAIADVASVVVDTAKVENDFLRITDQVPLSPFIPLNGRSGPKQLPSNTGEQK